MINCLSCVGGLDAEGIDLLTKIGVSIGTINEMVEVINSIDDEILASATPTQRLHILKNLVGHGNLDFSQNLPANLKKQGLQSALVKLLTNIENSEEMTQALVEIGGIDSVLNELTDRSQITELIEHLFSLGENQDDLIVNIVRKSNQTDPLFETSMTLLLYDNEFKELSREERLAVLCQINNYPDKEVVDNLRRVIDKRWFTDSSLEDKQRTLKAIASLTVHPGDEEIIDNTLDRILNPTSGYTISWENLGEYRYGYASSGNSITLNLTLILADNTQVEFSDSDASHLIAHTIAHEVSHLVNNDRENATYEYYLEEYRAYYVGFMAEHGRAPTRAEMAERVIVFVEDNGTYDSIWDALRSERQGDLMLRFINQYLGRNDVTRENVAECVREALNDSNDTTTAILPISLDDMDN